MRKPRRACRQGLGVAAVARGARQIVWGGEGTGASIPIYNAFNAGWREGRRMGKDEWTERTEDIWPLALEIGSNNDEQELSPDKQNNVVETCK